MGTTAQKLQAALDSKEAIRQAIIAKEVEVPSETPLSQYPAKIAAIETGGGGAVTPEEFKNAETFVYIDQFGEEVFREVVRIGDAPSPPPGPALENCTFLYWQNLPEVAEWHGETYVGPVYDSDNGDTFITLLVTDMLLQIYLSKGEGVLNIDKGEGEGTTSLNSAIALGTSTTLSFSILGVVKTLRIHSEVPYALGKGGSSTGSFIISSAGSVDYGKNILKLIVGNNCTIKRAFLRNSSPQYVVLTHGVNVDEPTNFSYPHFQYIDTGVVIFPNSYGGVAYGLLYGRIMYVLYPQTYAFTMSPVYYINGLRYHSMHKILSTYIYVVNASNRDNSIREIRWRPGVTSLPSGCMSGIANIRTVNVPEGVLTIGSEAFYQGGISVLILPSSLTSISNRGLASIYAPCLIVKAVTPPTLGSGTSFSSLERKTLRIFVPDESVEAYKSATNWSAFASYIYPISDLPNYYDVDENGYPK